MAHALNALWTVYPLRINQLSPRTFGLFFLCCLSLTAKGEQFDISNALELSKSLCGYELNQLQPALSILSIKRFPPDGVQLIFDVNLVEKSKALTAQMTISCVGPTNNSIQTSDSVPDAQAVIQEEDAGGRYFRHVASQTLINGQNWRASVAAIDYLLADGQRVDKNEIVACNADVISPCIFFSISKPKRLSKSYLKLAHSMIEKIAIVRPTGKANEDCKAPSSPVMDEASR